MASAPRRTRPRRRSLRNLLLVLGLVTAGAAAGLVWLGCEALRQDRLVLADREREGLELDADRLVQALERILADVEDQLAGWIVEPPAEDALTPSDGIGLLFTAAASRTVGSARLPFLPVLPDSPRPPSAVFADAEAAEPRDARRAADAYAALSRSEDPLVRALALMRLARSRRTVGDLEGALEAYRQMAALGDVPVLDLPAELVARDAQAELLSSLGRQDEAVEQASALFADLAAGRWALGKGQYEDNMGRAAKLASRSIPGDGLAAAHAARDLFAAWRARLDPRGRRVIHTEAGPMMAVWRGTAETMAAWVVEPAVLAARAAAGTDLAVAFSDQHGPLVPAAQASSSRAAIARTSAETRLPWTIHVSRTAGAAEPAGITRRQWVVAGLAVMLSFLFVGAGVIGLAVKREMDLARLQSDFVSAVSHEFRTPLAAMRQLSELLASGRVPLEARRQQYYESLAGESRRLQGLVENLLDFGRLDGQRRPYRLEALDPRGLVSQVVDEFRSQLSRPDCEIEVAGGTAEMEMLADRAAVSLALHNLLDNAVKYSGGRGPVRVEWTRKADRIALSVRDHGPGIAHEEQRRIFQRFVRGAAASAANVRGTGLGLAMVQLIAEAHGGDVVVDSEPGAGATFTLLLPAVQDGAVLSHA